MAARKFRIEGRVQGVGFRVFTQHAARRTGVTGWVRNLPGGAVESVAEGSDAALARFREFVAQGPPLARVDNLVEDDAPDGSWESFEIRG